MSYDFCYVIVLVSAAVSVFVSADVLRRIVAYVQQHSFFSITQYPVEEHGVVLGAVVVLAYVWNQHCY